jgi:hypothetical protein
MLPSLNRPIQVINNGASSQQILYSRPKALFPAIARATTATDRALRSPPVPVSWAEVNPNSG